MPPTLMHSIPDHARQPLYRWGLVVAAFLLGASLLATVWTTERGVADACGTLIRGQADLFHDGVRQHLHHLGRPPTAADLQALLEEYRGDGLRYVAVLDADLRPAVQAGERLKGQEQARPQGCSGVPVELGERYLIRFGAHLAKRGQAVTRRRPPFEVEFDPEVARALRAAARRTLGIGGLAAGIFLAIALGLLQWIKQVAESERDIERDRRLASLGEMSAVLAHEIRNPLASLKGNCQMLVRTGPGDPKAAARAERVLGEAVRLERLANDLLDFVKAGTLRREPVDITEFVGEVMQQAATERVRFEDPGTLPPWTFDTDRIHQVLANLIENAEQAGEGLITVRAEVVEGVLELSVQDDGPGIEEEDLEQVFEPFHTRRVHGTGLGLWISRRLVELHGGQLRAQNVPEGGAVFIAALPRS